MTALEAIKCSNNDDYLYIGSKTAYVWIGKAVGAVQALERATIRYFYRLQHSYIKSKKTLEKAYRDIEALPLRIEQCEELGKLGLKENLEKQLKIIKSNLPYFERNVKDLEKRIADFKPFIEREVKAWYDLKDQYGKNPTALILEGEESGDYWFYEEFIEKGF